MDEIIVGIDGSPGAAAALRWAVAEGRLRERPVAAVMAWGYLDQHHPSGDRRFDPAYGEPQAAEALAAAVGEALGAEAAGPVRLRTVRDLPGRALLEAGEGAAMLVMGARGLGGVRSALLGSVSDQALHHATCPVAVVRSTSGPGPAPGPGDAGPGNVGRTGAPVLVGVDGSAPSAAALRWAVDEARRRRAPLVAVHAHAGGGAAAEAAGGVLERALAAEGTDGVDVRPVVARTGAAHALLDAAADAALVVVGSRGRGGVAGLLLGSVSLHVARHAPCPTVVLPHDRPSPPSAVRAGTVASPT